MRRQTVSRSLGFLLITVAACALVVACDQAAEREGSVASTDDGAAAPVTPPSAEPAPVDALAPAEEMAKDVTVGGFAMSKMAPAMAPPPPSGVYATPVQAMPQPAPGDEDRDRYSDEAANPIKLVTEEPVSTFSIDVDTASYAVARTYLNDGEAPPSDAIRVEELINYFDYAYPLPADKAQPFSVSARLVPSPWTKDAQLLHVGLKGFDIPVHARPKANIVLLLDVSGSMDEPNKLPLLKKALGILVDQMGEADRIAIVVYAGAAGQVLEPTSGADKRKILAALENLSAGGSTAGGEGLRLAYALAEANFDEAAINRVILATDGDFNVGVTSDQRLEDFVADKRKTGVYLSVLGFGRGNYNDALMQTIAQSGNGTANYIDTLREAQKVLNDELQSALFPIANDVKIQVEFNPARVAEYRLIGYETRMLNREDFANDKVDAGEIGSGHEVTAIYEIAAPGSSARRIEESRYAAQPAPTGEASGEVAFLRLRYKTPGEDASKLIERPITDADAVTDLARADSETRFAVAVAGYGQLLKRLPYLSDFDFDDVIELAQGAKGDDAFGYRAEFIQLARLAKTSVSLKPLETEGEATPQ